MKQLSLSSVPDGERCRNKGRNGDDLSFYNITVAHFVVRLAMPLASKKSGGIGEGVLSMTVALGGTECCILRLPEGQDQPNFENQNSTKE